MVSSSGQPPLPFRLPTTGDLGKIQSRVLNQAYLVTPRPLNEVLTFVNCFFFQLLVSFHNLSIRNQVQFAYYLTSAMRLNSVIVCPVGWGCRIHRLHLCRGVRFPPTSVLHMTLNNLMVRFQWCWSFGERGVPLHCHRSQVHSGPER